MKETDRSSPKLLRVVSRWEIVGLSINDVLGSGVFLVPAAAFVMLGVMSIGAVLVAGLAVGLLVLCFAEASSYFDEPGGAYLYTREAFGRFIGFEVGWMTWLARVASVASLAAGFVEALAFVWPWAGSGLGRALVIIALLVILAWINVIGVKEGARFAVGLTIIKSLPLFIFVIAGLFIMNWSSLGVITLPSADILGEASLLLLFAYAGFENSPACAGEYKNPKKDVPFAIITMLIFITTLYVLVQLVAVGTFPPSVEKDSPLALSAIQFLGDWGMLMITIAAIISIGGNMSNTTLIGPRYLYALSKDGYGPSLMSKIHQKHKTPAPAIITQTAIALVLALSGSFVQLALLSIIARMFTYIGTAAAVPVLRNKFGQSEYSFRIPGGITIPVLALILCAYLMASTSWFNLIAGAAGLITGVLIYFFWNRNEQRVESRG